MSGGPKAFEFAGGMFSVIGFAAAFAFMAIGVAVGGWSGYWRGVVVGVALLAAFGAVGTVFVGTIIWMSR